MANKIDKKIVGYRVKPTDEQTVAATAVMDETVQRPDVLHGATYSIKPPHLTHPVTVTINDMELEGKTYPYEVFINTKDTELHQWTAALTRVMSAVFRKGGDVGFLLAELKEVNDPVAGAYNKKGEGFVPSLVADIGLTIEKHLNGNGK